MSEGLDILRGESMKYLSLLLTACAVSVLVGCATSTEVVNIYTDRFYDTDQQLFDVFTQQTGIQVNVLKLDADPLITRLEIEGEFSPADVVFIADAGRLGRAKAKDLFQPLQSNIVETLVPEHLQDEDNHWTALTKRARVLVYSKVRELPEALSTYEALTDEVWFGRIVTRSSRHVYNQSLVATMIEEVGEDATRLWIRGLVKNFASRDGFGNKNPIGNDRDQAKAVYSGIADVAIMNTYYLGRMLNSTDAIEKAAAESVGVFFPNQETYGTHINVSGAGIAKHSKRPQAAKQLIEFLLSESSQRQFADANFEYPVVDNVAPHPLLQSWGTFTEQTVLLSKLAGLSTLAFTLMEEEGWQ
jgi:iron(III) transport system substrate-binding protein